MRIVFMGTPESAVKSLQQLLFDGHDVVCVWTQPDKPAGRGEKLHSSPVKEFALAHQLPIEQPKKIRTDEAKALFASYNADLAVVVAYGRILPVEFLNAPKRGCINVHFSLLPKYRGAAPANWAIVNGEMQTGVTTMFVEQELDAGPILLQSATAIGEKETCPELMQRLSIIGATLLSETLSRLNEIVPKTQNHEDATFAPILTREHGLIDWADSANSIERSSRGFQPWPNAHTTYKGKRIIVWEAEVKEGITIGGSPGEVMAAHHDDLLIKAGQDSVLRILELQPESKRRMTSREFLSGSRLQVGERFGEV